MHPLTWQLSWYDMTLSNKAVAIVAFNIHCLSLLAGLQMSQKIVKEREPVAAELIVDISVSMEYTEYLSPCLKYYQNRK